MACCSGSLWVDCVGAGVVVGDLNLTLAAGLTAKDDERSKNDSRVVFLRLLRAAMACCNGSLLADATVAVVVVPVGVVRDFNWTLAKAGFDVCVVAVVATGVDVDFKALRLAMACCKGFKTGSADGAAV